MQIQFELLEPIARELAQQSLIGGVHLQQQQQQVSIPSSTEYLQNGSSSEGVLETVPTEAHLEADLEVADLETVPTEANLEADEQEQASENLGQHVSKDEGQNGEFGQNEPKESVSATERRYPDRVRKPPGHLDDFQLSESDEEEDDVITTVLANVKVDYCYKATAVPNSYEEAMASKESSEWNAKIHE